jgi:hypothetical protein
MMASPRRRGIWARVERSIAACAALPPHVKFLWLLALAQATLLTVRLLST